MSRYDQIYGGRWFTDYTLRPQVIQSPAWLEALVIGVGTRYGSSTGPHHRFEQALGKLSGSDPLGFVGAHRLRRAPPRWPSRR